MLTYVSRGLEPYRGFHRLMRALPDILRERPECQVVIVGEDKPHYGRSPKEGGNWRELMLRELDGQLDLSRVHFTGELPYEQFLRVIQISRTHVYLTYPFVLSWSMLEAMAAGCVVVGSDTPPVREVVVHGDNGLLVPFFDSAALVAQVCEVLAEPARFEHLRLNAISGIRSVYDFDRVIWPRHMDLLSRFNLQMCK